MHGLTRLRSVRLRTTLTFATTNASSSPTTKKVRRVASSTLPSNTHDKIRLHVNSDAHTPASFNEIDSENNLSLKVRCPELSCTEKKNAAHRQDLPFQADL